MLATKIEEAKRDEGFTLIELLVVVIIIGILAAIAIPVFLNQRTRAWDSAAQSDLRNAAVALESYFTDFGTYADVDGETPLSDEFGFVASPNVETPDVVTADGDTYCVTTSHANRSDVDEGQYEIRPGQAVQQGDCT